jgi:hypothetical protein
MFFLLSYFIEPNFGQYGLARNPGYKYKTRIAKWAGCTQHETFSSHLHVLLVVDS